LHEANCGLFDFFVWMIQQRLSLVDGQLIDTHPLIVESLNERQRPLGPAQQQPNTLFPHGWSPLGSFGQHGIR
jgi:hypothetical protein